MTDRQKQTALLFNYRDKSISHAGIAAIVYGVIAIASALLAWLQSVLYARLAPVAAWLVGSIMVAIISGALAFGIFRRSRVAVVLMLVLVIAPQLYTWFVARSFAGTIVSIFVTGFLLRGARRIFQHHAERAVESEWKVGSENEDEVK
jgi:hypothetical protein